MKSKSIRQQFQAEVRVSCNGHAADGRSILELLMLVAGCGALVELEAIGPDAPAAAIALSALIENGFHDAEEETNERPGSSLA
jgi:phosphocarrier protein HPr